MKKTKQSNCFHSELEAFHTSVLEASMIHIPVCFLNVPFISVTGRFSLMRKKRVVSFSLVE